MTHVSVLLCDLTHMGQGIAADTIPYATGCIAAYLEKHAPYPLRAEVARFPDEVLEMILELRPQVVGFSNYIWNCHLSCEISRRVKAMFPDIAVVMGGPNFPHDPAQQEEFLRSAGGVDFYIQGEGESAMLELVSRLRDADFDIAAVKRDGSPSVRTLDHGRLQAFPLAPRFKDLDSVPSPYLAGKLDRFFDCNLMPLIQTNRGCPFTCTYCVEGHPYYKIIAKRRNRETIAEEIKYIANHVKNNRQLFIADSNFGMYSEDVDTAAELGNAMDRYGFPRYIHVATGKNNKERVLECARLLKGNLRLSGSVQTLDPKVMENIRRKNISVTQLMELAQEARGPKANTYSEIILGLPGDSLRAHMDTNRGVVNAGFNIILSYTFMLLKGSRVHEEGSTQFGMRSKFRVLPRCFGEYLFGEETFLSGEIEEVCVDSDTLPLEDYLEARAFNLTTSLFYNDRIFEEALGVAVAAGATPFDWLGSIHERRDTFPPKVAAIYAEFLQDSREELWDDKDALLNFLCTPDNMRSYIDGKLGRNVIYTHRTIALTTAMKELNDIAFEVSQSLLAKHRPDALESCRGLLDQLNQYSLLRKNNALAFETQVTATFDLDFWAIQTSGDYSQVIEGLPQGLFLHRFEHDPQAVRTISEQLDLYGNDRIGLAKSLSRIPIQGLFRMALVTPAGDGGGPREHSPNPDR